MDAQKTTTRVLTCFVYRILKKLKLNTALGNIGNIERTTTLYTNRQSSRNFCV